MATDGTSPGSALLFDGQAVYSPETQSERRSGSGGSGGWQTLYHLDDIQGSTLWLTTSSGFRTDAWGYDAFGNVAGHNGPTTTLPFGYNGGSGYQSDPDTGLMLLGHRYYDPTIGRFLSSDPAGAGENWYAYCNNDPINGSDPLGLTDPKTGVPPPGTTMADGPATGHDEHGRPYWDDAWGGRTTLLGIGDLGIGGGSDSAFVPGISNGPAGVGSPVFLGLTPGEVKTSLKAGVANMASGLSLGLYKNSTYAGYPGAAQSRFLGGVAAQALLAAAGEAAPAVLSKACPFLTRLGLRVCFVAGTQVWLADGTTKPIEQIKEGDIVFTRDANGGPDGEVVAKRVLHTYEHVADHTVVVTLASGERIETTEEHPFFVQGLGWTSAGRLCIGNLLVPRAGPAEAVANVERKVGPTAVYNFEVEDGHSYFVGQTDSGVWVHNTCGGISLTSAGDRVVMAARTLEEQLIMEEALADGGSVIMKGPFGDPAFQASGWEKYQYTHESLRGSKSTVHWMANRITGAIEQVKIKLTPFQK